MLWIVLVVDMVLMVVLNKLSEVKETRNKIKEKLIN